MIQRVQSIYLLLASILMAATVFSPLGSFSYSGQLLTLYPIGWESKAGLGGNAWGILVFAVVASLDAFTTIFLYKKRKIQMLLCYLIMLFIAVFYIAVFAYAYADAGTKITLFKAEYGLIFPFCALVFCFMALQKIKADEKLVKSLDRIR